MGDKNRQQQQRATVGRHVSQHGPQTPGLHVPTKGQNPQATLGRQHEPAAQSAGTLQFFPQ
jgi:hypothetical protein